MSMARLHSSFQWNNKAEQAFHCGRSSEERRTPKQTAVVLLQITASPSMRTCIDVVIMDTDRKCLVYCLRPQLRHFRTQMQFESSSSNGLSMVYSRAFTPFVLYDSEAVDSMYDTEPNLVTGESAEEETEDSIMSPIAVGPTSPQPCNEDFTPKEGSPYEVPVYIPDDIPIPADLELRESSVPGAGLGIWAKVKIRMGERFGPYNGLQSATVKETTYGWEVCGDDMACT
ncbi:unnamed protein product [Leuciscus chuanchicus]